MNPVKFGLAIFFLCLIVLVSGCGDSRQLPTTQVVGKLTLDGKAVSGAEIWLVPKTPEVANAAMTIRPYAKTGTDGTFTISSYVTGDGAPIGDYTVIVQKAGGGGDSEENEDPESPKPAKGQAKTMGQAIAAQQRSRFPGKYGSPATSGLTFTVKASTNELTLDLKSN